MNEKNIRNFSIIAHIDHGKSTLADRLLEKCNAVSAREMEDQILDNMDLERERGITIKARAVTFDYTAQDGQVYTLNLIDTPGHVDFNYEVSRSLAACEGALLIVDASQGIEAQTLANTYLAMEHDLEIRPVINKIDLPAADPKRVKEEIENILAIPAEDAPEISAKLGINIDAVLEDIVHNLPAPKGDPNAPLKALIFDSYYDAYRGVIVYMRLKDGTIRPGMEIRMMATGATFKVLECGLMRPLGLEPAKQLEAGQVGYFTASIKDVHETQIGDTVTGAENPASEPLPGYRKVRSMVYCGIYTEDGSKYPDLRDALEKLQLNDASLTFEPETSVALGFGFRCGFLGMLHMEVIQERLEREFDLDLVTTLPSVIYEVYKTDGTMVRVDNPHNYPDPSVIEHAEEPYVKVTIVTPPDYVGNIMPMCQERRGEFKDMQYLDTYLVELHYEMPLNEIIYDFFDALKANTKGYASLDYELSGYRRSELVKVDMLLNGDQVDALSFIAHKDKAYPRARRLCEKLQDNIPRQLFEVPVQAAIGGRVIARETVKAMRKDVLAKCYGGDITRKKKKAGSSLGTVRVPTGQKKILRAQASRRGSGVSAHGAGADGGVPCRPQAGRVIFCPPASAGEPPRQRRALNDGGGAAERARPFRAKRRCATSARCRCRRRRSLPSSSWTSDFCPPASAGEPPRQRRALNDGAEPPAHCRCRQKRRRPQAGRPFRGSGVVDDKKRSSFRAKNAQSRHGAGADGGVPCRPQAGRVNFGLEAFSCFWIIMSAPCPAGRAAWTATAITTPSAGTSGCSRSISTTAVRRSTGRSALPLSAFAATRAWRATRAAPARRSRRTSCAVRCRTCPAPFHRRSNSSTRATSSATRSLLRRASVSWASRSRRYCAAGSSPSCSAAVTRRPSATFRASTITSRTRAVRRSSAS